MVQVVFQLWTQNCHNHLLLSFRAPKRVLGNYKVLINKWLIKNIPNHFSSATANNIIIMQHMVKHFQVSWILSIIIINKSIASCWVHSLLIPGIDKISKHIDNNANRYHYVSMKKIMSCWIYYNQAENVFIYIFLDFANSRLFIVVMMKNKVIKFVI